MGEFLFVHCETVVRCFGKPSSIRIPSTVREIGPAAFSDIRTIRDLSFEEGLVRIGANAFYHCDRYEMVDHHGSKMLARRGFENVTFPASLEVIEKGAFASSCLGHLKFAPGSRLRFIDEEAFRSCEFETAVLPAGFKEIDPSAFDSRGWPSLTWDGPPPLLVKDCTLYSADETILLGCFSSSESPTLPAHIEVIGRRAFRGTNCCAIQFENRSRLREIGEEAFSHCSKMKTIKFEGPSTLKTIGKRAFAGCPLSSITIPASLEAIDGSAFVGCPLLRIQVAVGNQNYRVEGRLLTTADVTEIVRYFGGERVVRVPETVEILGNSCFESSSYFERIVFEDVSKLRRIGSSAFSGCEFLTSITIPASVVTIGESAFKDCDGLDECCMDKKAVLVQLEDCAFAGCHSLRSFYFPSSVTRIGKKCFDGCDCLQQLTFGSGATLKTIVGDVTLEEILETLGFADISSLVKFEVSEEGVDLEFPGWDSVGKSGSTLVLVRSDK
jgi:hypothetical protein